MREVKLAIIRSLLGVWRAWLASPWPWGVLFVLALLMVGAQGWGLFILAFSGSMLVPWEREYTSLRFWGLGHNGVALAKHLSLFFVLRQLAYGILGGAGTWTLVPSLIGEGLNTVALLLGTPLMFGFIVLPFLAIPEVIFLQREGR